MKAPPPPHKSTERNGTAGTADSSILMEKKRISDRNKKQQSNDEPLLPPVAIDRAAASSSSPATTTTTILDEKTRISERKQNHILQQQQQGVGHIIRDGNSRQQHNVMPSNDATADAVSAIPGNSSARQTESSSSTTIATIRPGAVHVYTVSESNTESRGEDTSPRTTSIDHPPRRIVRRRIVSAQLVDEDEIEHRAELLLQQMLAQTAVAELVDADEMRQQAYKQAALEIQQNNNKRQQKLRIIAGCLFLTAIIIAIVVVVMALFLSDTVGQGQSDDGVLLSITTSMVPTRSITPSIEPSFSPTITPSVFPTMSPSTAPSSMPTSTTSWLQIGNSINGVQDSLGATLAFSADGNTVVVDNADEVRAYSFHNETDKWKQLGQDIKKAEVDKFCLSPNGKFLGVTLYLWKESVSVVRVFALRQDKTKTNATSTPDADTDAVPMLWEQIGPDTEETPIFVDTVSLTDDLILAIGYTNKIFVYQIDKNQTAWVRKELGQELEYTGHSMQLATANRALGKEWVLAVGGLLTARIYTRSSYYDNSWIFEHEMAANDNSNTEMGIVQLSLSMYGETIAIGFQKGSEVSLFEEEGSVIDANSFFSTWCSLLRVFSYNVTSMEWIQLGKDLKADPSFFFGRFSLSTNGKVLVTTTALQEKEVYHSGDYAGASRVFGQVRTWDFIADNSGNDIGGGEWMQREAVLEVGPWDSGFGWDIALSADGNRLAASAIAAIANHSGNVRVFELQQ